MKITVLNGSPKGDLSVTMQSVKFIQKKFPDHAFNIINISQSISSIDKNDDKFNEIIEEVRSADAVLWGSPAYVYLVPSQYMRFIELVREKNAEDAFKGKYAAVLTTSIHFFDNCAHSYLRSICDDLGMKYAGGFSADSYDLLDEKERARLLLFAEGFLGAIADRKPYARRYYPLPEIDFSYTPATPESKIGTNGRKIVVIKDDSYEGTNTGGMINRFRNCFDGDVEVIDLKNDVDIKGGCMGCIQCGFDHKCIYTGKDEYIETYEKRVKPADVIVFAGAIRERFFSSKWKQFLDRAFFNTHTPTMTGKQIGFLVSGRLSANENMREILDAFIEWQGANQVDIITDEPGDSQEIDTLISNMAERIMDFAAKEYIKPATFLGIGGMKIFRDDVWGRHRFVFQADHEYFEKNGIYDFPQDDTRAIETNEFMFQMTSNPEGREAIRKMLKTEMVKPHKKVVERE